METRATWTDLIAGVGVEIADVYDQGQEEYIVGIGNVLRIDGNAAGAEKHVMGKTGVGTLRRFDEGADVPSGQRYRSYRTDIAWHNYGRSIDVTKNAIEDRDFSAELDEMKDLSLGANYSQDESGLQLFNGGFATTRDVNGYHMTWYGDSEELFSTVHPTQVPGASTQSNASSTSVVFGHDNLEVAKVALVEQQTDDGLAMALLGKPMLVMPPALEREGREETESELDPETANNAINVFRGTIDLATSSFLAAANGGSDTLWALIIPSRHRLYHGVRQSPTLESDVDIKSKTVTFTVDARWADYVGDWRRTWASQGTTADYSS